MTRARVAALQTARPPKGMRMLRGTVSAVSPLTVQIAGSAAVVGLPVPGQTYKVGDAVLIAVQEPAVGPVYPLTPTPPPDLTPYAKTTALAGYVPTTAFSALPMLTDLNAAPDGFAVAQSGATNNPLSATVLVETMTASWSGNTWRFQRVSHESNGTTRTRRLWSAVWSAWAAASTA